MLSPREYALPRLTVILQSVPLPKSGKYISDIRASVAAQKLMGALQHGELKLLSTALTVCALLESGADRILPELDSLCLAETGRGITKVLMDPLLTELLQQKEPAWLTGLESLRDVRELVLTPSSGALDVRLLPLVRRIGLHMGEAYAGLRVNAYTFQELMGIWPADPEAPSTVNYHNHRTDEYLRSAPLGGHIEEPDMLLTDSRSRVTVAPMRRTPQEAPLATRGGSTILGFMRESEAALPRVAKL